MSAYELVIAAMGFSLLIAFAVVLFYLRYKRQLTIQQLRLSEAETNHQKALLHAVIQSQEEERKRIGMNLHDDVGSALSSLRMMIDRFEPGGNEQVLQQSKAVVDRVIADVRNISHDLSPIRTGAYHFTDAVEDLCDAINESGRLEVELRIEADEKTRGLKNTDALALYRVISELLNNTIRHAKAKRVQLRMEEAPDRLIVNYSDDGIGLPQNTTGKKGMGLQNMESRLGMIGASYEMPATPGSGFSMIIQLPFSA